MTRLTEKLPDEFWHKICALIMRQQGLQEVSITANDINEAEKEFSNQTIVVHASNQVITIYFAEKV